MGREETRLTRQCVDHLRVMQRAGEPIWWVKIHVSAFQQAGVPDLLVIHGGRVLMLELKTQDGVVSPLQTRTHQEIDAAGGTVRVIRTIDDFRKVLDENATAARG